MTAELYSDVAYSYDGTFEGLLSAIFATYENRETPTDIAPEDRLRLRLGQTARFIDTDLAKARRVERGVVRQCGRGAFNGLLRAYLSCDDEASTAIYQFIRRAMREAVPSPCDRCPRSQWCRTCCQRAQARGILSALSDPEVAPIFRMMRRLANERESMLQFLRFEHLEGDLWYGRCNPTCLVIPTLMDHFVGRFSGASFIIHDETHQMAGVSAHGQWVIADLGEGPTKGDLGFPLPNAAPEEAQMQEAWKRFYDAITVQARFNPELRTALMPQRFWPYLTEMQSKARF